MDKEAFDAAIKLQGAYIRSTSEAMYVHYGSKYVGLVGFVEKDSYDLMFDRILELLAYAD